MDRALSDFAGDIAMEMNPGPPALVRIGLAQWNVISSARFLNPVVYTVCVPPPPFHLPQFLSEPRRGAEQRSYVPA